MCIRDGEKEERRERVIRGGEKEERRERLLGVGRRKRGGSVY